MIQKMKKSKGFTLIEMLVVIAIIAVLVSIIIPTVSSATDKAAAATNAANLRSLVAEATTKYLTNDQSYSGNVQITVSDTTVTAAVTAAAPKSAKCGGCAKDLVAVLTWKNDTFEANYGGYTLADFQKVAAGDTKVADMKPSTTATETPTVASPPAPGT